MGPRLGVLLKVIPGGGETDEGRGLLSASGIGPEADAEGDTLACGASAVGPVVG